MAFKPRFKKFLKRTRRYVRRVSPAVKKYVKRALIKNKETKSAWALSSQPGGALIGDQHSQAFYSCIADGITVGDTNAQRDGNEIYITSMRGNIEIGGPAGFVTNSSEVTFVRVICFYSPVAVQVADLPASVNAPIDNNLNAGIYVMKDKIYRLQSAGANSPVYSSHILGKLNLKIRKRVHYEWNTNSVERGFVYFYAISNQNNSNANHAPTLTYQPQVFFKDY